MSDFNKQELGLIHDLINVAWGTGTVKSPQMAQGIEQLRGKVLMMLEPKDKPPQGKEEPKGSKDMKK